MTEMRPAMSVILAVGAGWRAIETTLRHLRAQTAAGDLEIVLVAPDDLRGEPDLAASSPFAGWRIVRVPAPISVPRANAAGVRAASSDIVALAEDHCFPEAGWAEALIAAHRRPYAAVAPVIRNANPSTATSCADFLIGYGPWMEPSAAGPRAFLPGHNTSYKRVRLLEYGDALERMLESETALHLDLCRRGHELYLEPASRSAHVNFALLRTALPIHFHCGRVFAARRFSSQQRARSLLYGLAAPLIPLVRGWQITREAFRPGRSGALSAAMLPALAVSLAFDGAGQMAGYLFGSGRSLERLAEVEFDRMRFITDEDRRVLARQVPEPIPVLAD